MPAESSTGAKKRRKNLYVSYSVDAGYTEKKFVSLLVSSLKQEYNLDKDVWFDHEEGCLASAAWMALRVELAERCKGALIVLSSSYIDNHTCLNELKTLLERNRVKPNAVRIYLVLYEPGAEVSSAINDHLTSKVDLRDYDLANVSEKVFVAAGSFGPALEKKFSSSTTSDKGTERMEELNDEFKKKSLIDWSIMDVQSWLNSKNVPPIHMDAFLERNITGFLLSSMTEKDLATDLLVDNKHIAKKIPELVLERLTRDMNQESAWHYQIKNTKPKPSSIYLIYDPKDLPVAYNMKRDLEGKGFLVLQHEKLGNSRDEFLKVNGPILAVSENFLVILSENGGNSPFVYNETVFAEWLDRNVCSVVVNNQRDSIRPGLKAILQDKPAASLNTENFKEDMDVIEYLVAPANPVPSNVVLEQGYVSLLTENVKFLADLLDDNLGDINTRGPSVFISYQWDVQVQVYKLTELLQYYGIVSWADFSSAATPQRSAPNQPGQKNKFQPAKLDTLRNQIIRNIRKCSAVVLCFSEQYSQSANCQKDMLTALTLGKPMIPVLLTNTSFPPDAPPEVKSVMEKYEDRVLDLSTGRLLQQNLPRLVNLVKKCQTLEQDQDSPTTQR